MADNIHTTYPFISPEVEPADALHQAESVLAFLSDVIGERNGGFTVNEGGIQGFSTILDAVRNVMTVAAVEYGDAYIKGFQDGCSSEKTVRRASPVDTNRPVVPDLTEQADAGERRQDERKGRKTA